MKKLLIVLLIISVFGCIPVRIAPNIETDKVVVAKKFKRDLPKSHAFIFEDPKDANEFYNFINTKYDLKHQDVEYNVPIQVQNKTYYLSFHEREKATKTINLVPILIDAKLESNGNTPLMDGLYSSRKGHWYLVLTVYDDDLKDCLKADYPNRAPILEHLRKLQKEYLTTHNYIESYLLNTN